MTDPAIATSRLIAQLRVLAQLTRTEAQSARLRLAQATGDDVGEVLRRVTTDADARATRIAAALHGLGALPDPVTPVLGPVAALVRGALEQAQPLDEALLGDLALERQLGDRARYVAVLADTAGEPAVRALADELETAHAAIARWLSELLAGSARGGATGLVASPLQRLAAQVTRAANAPGQVTRAANAPGRPTPEVAATVRTAADRAVGDDDDRAAAGEPGGPATEPPVPGFAQLPAHAAIAALRTLDDPREVAAALAAERAHGNRPGVLTAARVRAAAVDPR